ncbi:hypothetical protein RB213_011224, partial [Colletotrichum asianum]
RPRATSPILFIFRKSGKVLPCFHPSTAAARRVKQTAQPSLTVEKGARWSEELPSVLRMKYFVDTYTKVPPLSMPATWEHVVWTSGAAEYALDRRPVWADTVFNFIIITIGTRGPLSSTHLTQKNSPDRQDGSRVESPCLRRRLREPVSCNQ